MFVSSLVWLSRSLRSPTSNVEQLLLQAVIATLLAVASPVIPPKDQCLEDPANFAHQMHTIGSVDGRLWAITRDNWTVYELMPCQQNLNHSCMLVSSPVDIDTKWSQLSESVKSAAGAKDFNFKVNNSAVMNSSYFQHMFLAMDGSFITETKYFGFEFGPNQPRETEAVDATEYVPGLWLSSDVEDKAYRLLDFGKQVTLLRIDYVTSISDTVVIEIPDTKMNICDVTQQDGGNLEVEFTNATCDRNMNWTVVKGVHYRNQFYFFTLNKVYSFSNEAETSRTTVEIVSYGDFFHCHKPTTLMPSSPPNATSSPPNATSSPPNATNSLPNATNSPPINISIDAYNITTKGSTKSKTLMIVIIIVGVILGLLIIVGGFWFYVEIQVNGTGNQMCTTMKNGGQGTRGRILSGKGKQPSQQLKASLSKANCTGKAKSSVNDSKMSMKKVISVAQPKSKAFKAKSTF